MKKSGFPWVRRVITDCKGNERIKQGKKKDIALPFYWQRAVDLENFLNPKVTQ